MKANFTIISEAVAARAMIAVRDLPLDPLHEVIIREKKKGRSLAQNRLLHSWCSHVSEMVAETHGEHVSPKKWKWFFKDLFLGYDVVEVRGKMIHELRHTSDLKVKPFTELLEKIDAYCVTDLQITLPHPSDTYYEAMGKKESGNGK